MSSNQVLARLGIKIGSDFSYVGVKGTYTPLHSDVFGSFSWSANVVGRKKWYFFPPGTEQSLRDSNGDLPRTEEDLKG